MFTAVTFAGIAMLSSRPGALGVGSAPASPAAGEASRRPYAHSLLILLSSLFSFTLATYLFTMAAAELRPDGRASALAFCSSLALCLAVAQLFVGVAPLVSHFCDNVDVARYARRLAHLVLLMIGAFMGMTTIDAAGFDLPEGKAWSQPLAYACMAMVGALVLWLVVLNVRRGRAQPSTVRHVVAASATATVAFGVAAAVTAEQQWEWNLPAVAYGLLAALLFVLLAALALVVELDDGLAPEGGAPGAPRGAASNDAAPRPNAAQASHGERNEARISLDELRPRFANHSRDSYTVLFNVMKGVSIGVMIYAVQQIATGGMDGSWRIPLLLGSGLAVVLTYAGTTIGVNLLAERFGVLDALLPLLLTVAEAWPIFVIASNADDDFVINAWIIGMVCFNVAAAVTLRLARARMPKRKYEDRVFAQLVGPYRARLYTDSRWALLTAVVLLVLLGLATTMELSPWLAAGLAGGVTAASYIAALVYQDAEANRLHRELTAMSLERAAAPALEAARTEAS